MTTRNSKAPLDRARKRTVLAVLVACGLLIAIGSGIVLANGNPFAKYPPAKAAILQREQNDIATAQAGVHAPKNPNDIPAPSPPQATSTAGINNSHAAGPFSACKLTVNNSWQGPVNGKGEVVYAGVTYADPSMCSGPDGALAIFNQHDGTAIGWFTAPAGVTSLTITTVNGDVMTLRTNTDASLTFDLSTNTFSSGS